MSCPNYEKNTKTIIRVDETEKNCSGLGMTVDELKNYWSVHDCPTFFYRKIHSSPNNQFNLTNFKEVQEDFDNIFSLFFTKYKITVPGAKYYDSFQQTLINTCSNNPEYQLYGACQLAAESICTSCTSTDITNNKDLLKLCGCQVKSIDNINQYASITPECDPLCAHEQVVKNVDINGNPQLCNSAVCVINNISINTANSITGGSSFTQVCPQCEFGGCRCILDTSISDNATSVGINDNIQFNQYCGNEQGNSVCLNVDPITGKSFVVDCQNAIKPLEPKEYPIIIPIWFYVLFAILIIIFILIIMYHYFDKKNRFYKNIT